MEILWKPVFNIVTRVSKNKKAFKWGLKLKNILD